MSKGRCQNLIGISLYKMSMSKLTPSPTTAGTSDQFRDAIEFREPRPDFSIVDELQLMSKKYIDIVRILCQSALEEVTFLYIGTHICTVRVGKWVM